MKSKSEEQKTAKIIAEMAKRRLVREGKLNEGPLNQLWQGAKGAATNLGSPIKGAKAGFQGQAGADKNKPIIDRTVKGWSQLAGQIKASGADPTPEQFKQFVDKQLPGNSIDADQVDLTDPNSVFQSISQASHQAAVNKSLGGAQPAGPAATAPAAPATGGGNATGGGGGGGGGTGGGDAFSQVQKLIGQLTTKQKAAVLKQLGGAAASTPASKAPSTAPAAAPAATPSTAPAAAPAATPGLDPTVSSEIVSALTSMGYTKKDAQDKVAALPPGVTTEEGLRQIISGKAAPAAAPAATPSTPAAAPATPAPATPAAPATPNLGPSASSVFPGANAPAQSASVAANKVKQGLTAGKINRKPSIAEMKKLKSKLVVKEMALAKLKRDKGII